MTALTADDRPVIAVTTWRRPLDTVVAEQQLLYTLAADYVECVRRAGGLPVLLPVVEPDEAAAVLRRCDALLVSGGADVDPAVYGRPVDGARDTDRQWDLSDRAYIRAAHALRMPTLGICRGLQIMNVAFGGTLLQEVTGGSGAHPTRPDDRGAALAYRHPVTLTPGSRLARIYGGTVRDVTSLHHQGIDDLSSVFAATARAPDGLIEGIETTPPDDHTDGSWWAVAVQWHPEKMGGAEQALFAALVTAAVAGRTAPRPDGRVADPGLRRSLDGGTAR